MEHAKIDDQIFSPLSTATGGGTVELPTTGAQLQAPPSPQPRPAQPVPNVPCLAFNLQQENTEQGGRIVAVIISLTSPRVHVPDCQSPCWCWDTAESSIINYSGE